MSTDTIWTTTAFTAAQPGWRIAVFTITHRGDEDYDSDERYLGYPLAGWLTQENPHGACRVVPAWCRDNGEGLVPATAPDGTIHPVISPEQAEPRDSL